jgi:hypothetical protein
MIWALARLLPLPGAGLGRFWYTNFTIRFTYAAGDGPGKVKRLFYFSQKKRKSAFFQVFYKPVFTGSNYYTKSPNSLYYKELDKSNGIVIYYTYKNFS